MRERAQAVKRNIRKHGLKAGAIGVGGFALLSPNLINAASIVPGDPGEQISKKDAAAIARRNYQEAFKEASPADKFKLKYLRRTYHAVPQYRHNTGLLSGLLAHELAYYDTTINDGCLEKTAYNPARRTLQGSASINFLSGVVRGNFNTAETEIVLDPDNPDQLSVKPGGGTTELRFKGLSELDGEGLVPANHQTSNVLATNGCQEGLVEVSG